MQKDDSVYVGHMLDAARKALAFAREAGPAGYPSDEKLQLALTHLLQVIGEAARRVSEGFRARYPEVPWSAIAGMRSKIVHDYMSVDLKIVWDTVDGRLPELVEQLRRILDDE